MSNLPSPLPEDIKTCWYEPLLDWLKVIRRLQSCARKQEGYAVVSLRVLVNQDGIPVNWTSPTMTLIEPKGRDCSEVMLMLGE